MMKSKVILLALTIISLGSCTNPLEKQLQLKNKEVVKLEDQVDYLQQTNTSLLERLSDMSIVSKTEAASIKQSLETLGDQYGFIQKLTSKIHEKDSLNMALVNNLRSSLIDFDDEDVAIEVKGNAVYVSISDKMLFASGSSKVNRSAYGVLQKVSRIINTNDNIDVLVEGHTDNVPINTEKYSDNWDLSVLRATAVVRELYENFNVQPERLTAAGRSHFIPKAENETSTGRSINRRTEIIITPKLDQFFKLMEAPEVIG